MNDFQEMIIAFAWPLWAVVGLVSLWFARRAGWGWFAAGFFLLAFAWAPLDLGWGAGLAETAAALCFLMGVVAMKLAGGAAAVGTEVRSNPYFSTDELIARAAAQRTVNEDVEFIKKRWLQALGTFAARNPEQTLLRGGENFGRTLWLERYTDMDKFEGMECGQMRTVKIDFSGPGDALPWLSVTAEYTVDQVPVGRFTVANVKVLREGEDPSRLVEFRRMERFLRTGEVKVRFEEILDGLIETLNGVAKVAVAVPVFMAAAAYRPVRSLLQGKKPVSRFVPTRCPDSLPPEQTGLPAGYWFTLLTDQAGLYEEVLEEVRGALKGRSEFGFKAFEREVVQWGGFSLKEVRQQMVLEFRRAKVKITIHRYGKDLYVRWDSHVNRQCWMLFKFPYQVGLGYRFENSFLSWVKPLFVEAPAMFEFAPAGSWITDFDWADVDALQDLAHEILTGVVRRLKERYNIKQEIDYQMREGDRSEPDSEDKAPGRGKGKQKKWRRAGQPA